MNTGLINTTQQLQDVVNAIGQEGGSNNYIADALQGYSSAFNSVSTTVSSVAPSGSGGIMSGGIGIMFMAMTVFVSLAVYQLFFRDPFAR